MIESECNKFIPVLACTNCQRCTATCINFRLHRVALNANNCSFKPTICNEDICSSTDNQNRGITCCLNRCNDFCFCAHFNKLLGRATHTQRCVIAKVSHVLRLPAWTQYCSLASEALEDAVVILLRLSITIFGVSIVITMMAILLKW